MPGILWSVWMVGLMGPRIIYGAFESNSSFHVKCRTAGKFNFYFSRDLSRRFHFDGGLGTRLSFYGV